MRRSRGDQEEIRRRSREGSGAAVREATLLRMAWLRRIIIIGFVLRFSMFVEPPVFFFCRTPNLTRSSRPALRRGWP